MSYPLITAGMTDTQATRFVTACTAMLAAVDAGEIANPIFLGNKETINRVFERSFRDAMLANLSRGALSAAEEDMNRTIYYISPALHTVRGTIAKIEKIKTDQAIKSVALALLAEIAPVADAVKALKDGNMVVKREIKPAGERDPRFVAPRASSVAAKRVQALLVDLMAANYAALLETLATTMRRQLSHFVAARDAAALEGKTLSLSGYAKANRSADINFLSRVTGDDRPRSMAITVNTDAETTIQAIATRDAEDIRDAFVAKNLRKIVSIVDAKEASGVSLTDAMVFDHSISMGGFRGDFRVAFADGSGFEFSNSVVWSQSVHGRTFCRYPLTFHNVKLAGGVKMPRPSEARMNTVFTGA